jgi:hypothetical protein
MGVGDRDPQALPGGGENQADLAHAFTVLFGVGQQFRGYQQRVVDVLRIGLLLGRVQVSFGQGRSHERSHPERLPRLR